jgi:hypothetical protein
MLNELFLTKKCYKNNLIDVNINKIKKVIKMNDREFSQYEIDDIKFLINMLSNYGPTKYSNWVIDDYLLMGAVPYNCNDLETLINSGVTLFLSLREDDEIYQLCYREKTLNENIIFWRFRIPDFDTKDPEDVKAVVDNILNYLNKNSNKKVMIHCQGGHGRTGTITCCILAVLLMNKYFPKNIFKVLSEIKNKINLLKYKQENFIIFQKEIIELSETIFKYVQFYVTLSLATHRKTDSLDFKEVNNIIVPETPAQKVLVCEVIRLYIEFYLRNNYFITSENHLDFYNECNKNKTFLNNEFKEIWKCPLFKN